MNMQSRSGGPQRLAPPGTHIRNFDFITSPIPSFEQNHLQNSEIGSILRRGIGIDRIVITAGCTNRGAAYLSASQRDITIFNMGTGTLGVGSSEEHWGSSGCSKEFMKM